jgi:hypothetical protein
LRSRPELLEIAKNNLNRWYAVTEPRGPVRLQTHGLSQYSSLNDPDGFAEIEGRQGLAASASPGIVAEFPLHSARIMAVAAGSAFFIKDFLQHLVMEPRFALRGE